MRRSVILSHSHKFIFFAAGKTGTTSIERALAPLAAPYELSAPDRKLYGKHMPPVVLRERLPADVYETYFKFAFVRNPWDWTVSRALFLDRGSWLRRLAPRRRITPAVLDSLRRVHAPHFRGIAWADTVYQHARLADRSGRLLPDYIGRFETLQSDFDAVCDRLGIPRTQLPRLNATRSSSYQGYYDDETRQLVAARYRRDIRVFGYSFEGLIDPARAVRERPFPE